MEIIKSTIEHLKQFIPFRKMPAEDLELLVSECEINYFSAGEIILDNISNVFDPILNNTDKFYLGFYS